MTNDRINVVGTNIAEKAAMIWNVADMLRGPYRTPTRRSSTSPSSTGFSQKPPAIRAYFRKSSRSL